MTPLHVAYDECCRLCLKAARLVSLLDRRGLIVEDRAHHPRHPQLKAAPDRLATLVAWEEESESVLRGFDAICAIVKRLPGGFLAKPLLLFLHRTGLGERLYRWVATHRKCRKA